MLVCSPPTFQLCCVCVWVRESAPLSRGFKMALACLLLLSWTGGTFSNVDRRAARRRDWPASCRCQGAGGQAYAWRGAEGEGGDKGGLGDGSAPPAVVGGGVVFFPDTRGRLGGVGGGGPAVAGDWRLGITYDDLLTLEGWPHRLRS